MLSILLLLSPLPFAVAIPRPQSGDFESDLRSFPPDDSNNVAIPDQPAKFFSDEGVGVPSFSTNSWPVATEDNAFFNLDDPNSLDYSLVPSTSNLDEWGVPFFALQSKEYCKTIQEAAFCSSGSPTERFALPGEIDVTLLNAEQILDSFVLPYYTCDAPRAVYCCTTSFPREPIIVHSPSGIDRYHYPADAKGCNLAGAPENVLQLNILDDEQQQEWMNTQIASDSTPDGFLSDIELLTNK